MLVLILLANMAKATTAYVLEELARGIRHTRESLTLQSQLHHAPAAVAFLLQHQAPLELDP